MPPSPCDASGDSDISRPLYLAVPLILDDEQKASAGNWHSILAIWALGCLAAPLQLEAAEALAPHDGTDDAEEEKEGGGHKTRALGSVSGRWDSTRPGKLNSSMLGATHSSSSPLV